MRLSSASSEFQVVGTCAACSDTSEKKNCIAWQYTNRSNGITGMMYECDGKLSYQSFGNITEWHVSVERVGGFPELLFPCQQMVFSFNATGNVNKLKSTVLWRVGDSCWDGFDCKGRAITVLFKRTFNWCTACECWH